MTAKTLLGLPLAVPKVNVATCQTCGMCVEVCPSDVLCLEDGKVVESGRSPFGCIGCGHCMAMCPSGSITVEGRGIGGDDRLEMPRPETQATADQLEALLLARRATRMFKDEPVPRSVLDRVIAMAATAPMGIPPSNVELLVLDTPEKVQAFAEDLVAGFPGTLRLLKILLFLAGPFFGRKTREMFRSFVFPLLQTTWKQRRQGRDVLLWNAPAAILFHHGPYADSTDSIIAATYAIVAAESLRLATCPIGTVAPMLNQNRAVKRKYGIPKENRCAFALILGFPKHRFARAIRRRFAGVAYV